MLYLPALLLGLFVAVFWFVSMYLKFGTTYLDSFYSDQVGIRVTDQIYTILINLILAVALMVGMFFPWAFFGFKDFKIHVKKLIAQNQAFFWWVVVWVISIILMSAMVTKFYERYLLPVIPLAAVGLAWLLSQNSGLARQKAVTVFQYIFFLLNIIVLLAALFLNLGMDAAWFIYPGLLLGIVALVILFKNIKDRRDTIFWLGISIMLLFYNAAFITYQISLPHQGKQVAEFVAQNSIPKGSRIAFIGHLHTGSKIRIGLGNAYYMTDLPKEGYQGRLKQYDYIICDEEIKSQLDEEMFDVETAAITWDLKLIPEMMRSILAGTYPEMLHETGKRYYWIERK